MHAFVSACYQSARCLPELFLPALPTAARPSSTSGLLCSSDSVLASAALHPPYLPSSGVSYVSALSRQLVIDCQVGGLAQVFIRKLSPYSGLTGKQTGGLVSRPWCGNVCHDSFSPGRGLSVGIFAGVVPCGCGGRFCGDGSVRPRCFREWMMGSSFLYL